MKKRIKKLSGSSLFGNPLILAAEIMAVALAVSIPAYAWFANQMKAAEMFKVGYPDALYINAAHREDRIFFDLDGIDINEYRLDPYTQKQITDVSGNAIKVDQKMYAFSVSGSNTTAFRLQMAHTTNNLFTYTLYEADQFDNYSDALAAANDNTELIVRYDQNLDSHTENTIQVIGDIYSNTTNTLYYVRKSTPLTGSYRNSESSNNQLGIKDADNKYYAMTYGDDINVQANAVPKYWVSDVTLKTSGADKEVDANKNFCKYFILVVTWDDNQQKQQTEKETDLVYFAVRRVN